MGCSPFGEQDGFGLVFVVWGMHESLDSSCQQGSLGVESADGKGCAQFQVAVHIALGCLGSLASRVSLCGNSVGSMAEEACFEASWWTLEGFVVEWMPAWNGLAEEGCVEVFVGEFGSSPWSLIQVIQL